MAKKIATVDYTVQLEEIWDYGNDGKKTLTLQSDKYNCLDLWHNRIDITGISYSKNGKDLVISTKAIIDGVENVATGDIILQNYVIQNGKNAYKYIKDSSFSDAETRGRVKELGNSNDGVEVVNPHLIDEYYATKGLVVGTAFSDTVDVSEYVPTEADALVNKGLTVSTYAGDDKVVATSLNDTLLLGTGKNTYEIDAKKYFGNDTVLLTSKEGFTLRLKNDVKDQITSIEKVGNDIRVTLSGQQENETNLGNTNAHDGTGNPNVDPKLYYSLEKGDELTIKTGGYVEDEEGILSYVDAADATYYKATLNNNPEGEVAVNTDGWVAGQDGNIIKQEAQELHIVSVDADVDHEKNINETGYKNGNNGEILNVDAVQDLYNVGIDGENEVGIKTAGYAQDGDNLVKKAAVNGLYQVGLNQDSEKGITADDGYIADGDNILKAAAVNDLYKVGLNQDSEKGITANDGYIADGDNISKADAVNGLFKVGLDQENEKGITANDGYSAVEGNLVKAVAVNDLYQVAIDEEDELGIGENGYAQVGDNLVRQALVDNLYNASVSDNEAAINTLGYVANGDEIVTRGAVVLYSDQEHQNVYEGTIADCGGTLYDGEGNEITGDALEQYRRFSITNGAAAYAGTVTELGGANLYTKDGDNFTLAETPAARYGLTGNANVAYAGTVGALQGASLYTKDGETFVLAETPAARYGLTGDDDNQYEGTVTALNGANLYTKDNDGNFILAETPEARFGLTGNADNQYAGTVTALNGANLYTKDNDGNFILAETPEARFGLTGNGTQEYAGTVTALGGANLYTKDGDGNFTLAETPEARYATTGNTENAYAGKISTLQGSLYTKDGDNFVLAQTPEARYSVTCGDVYDGLASELGENKLYAVEYNPETDIYTYNHVDVVSKYSVTQSEFTGTITQLGQDNLYLQDDNGSFILTEAPTARYDAIADTYGDDKNETATNAQGLTLYAKDENGIYSLNQDPIVAEYLTETSDEIYGTITFRNLAKQDIVGADGSVRIVGDNATNDVQDIRTYGVKSVLNNAVTSFAGTYITSKVEVEEGTNKNLAIAAGRGNLIADLTNASAVNVVNGNVGNDTILTGKGRDVLKLGLGENTIIYDIGPGKTIGNDVYTMTANENLIINMKEYVQGQVTRKIIGKDLVITAYKVAGNDGEYNIVHDNKGKPIVAGTLTIKNYQNQKLANSIILVTDPEHPEGEELITAFNRVELSNAETTFAGTYLYDYVTSVANTDKNLKVAAGEGNNVIDLSESSGANTITAGSGNDTVSGGMGNDLISLGAGMNTYKLDVAGNSVFGSDSIILTANSTLALDIVNTDNVFDGNNLAEGQISYSKYGNDIIATVYGADGVKDYYDYERTVTEAKATTTTGYEFETTYTDNGTVSYKRTVTIANNTPIEEGQPDEGKYVKTVQIYNWTAGEGDVYSWVIDEEASEAASGLSDEPVAANDLYQRIVTGGENPGATDIEWDETNLPDDMGSTYTATTNKYAWAGEGWSDVPIGEATVVVHDGQAPVDPSYAYTLETTSDECTYTNTVEATAQTAQVVDEEGTVYQITDSEWTKDGNNWVWSDEPSEFSLVGEEGAQYTLISNNFENVIELTDDSANIDSYITAGGDALHYSEQTAMLVGYEANDDVLGKITLKNLGTSNTLATVLDPDGDNIFDKTIEVVSPGGTKVFGTIGNDEITIGEAGKYASNTTVNSLAGDDEITSYSVRNVFNHTEGTDIIVSYGTVDAINLNGKNNAINDNSIFSMVDLSVDGNDVTALAVDINGNGNNVVTYTNLGNAQNAAVSVNNNGVSYKAEAITQSTPNTGNTSIGSTISMIKSDEEIVYRDSASYNIVVGNDEDNVYVYEKGGKDQYHGGFGDDRYEVLVSDFSKSTNRLLVSDKDGDDVLYIQKLTSNTAAFYFDVDSEGNVFEDAKYKGVAQGSSILSICDKKYARSFNASHVAIANYAGDGNIEEIYLSDKLIDMDATIANIKQDVTAWLDRNGFESTIDVMQNGNQYDKASMLACFNNAVIDTTAPV